jgi:hypothetical protein
MDHWVNLIAMATGLVAICYTIRESRRNNKVLLKIKECQASYRQSVDENSGNPFHELRVVVKNCGIPLHSVNAVINFSHPSEPGRFTFPLKRRHRTGDHDEFAKGMIAEFGVLSYELDKYHFGFVRALAESKNEDAWLCIFSQGYLAAEFRVAGISDHIKMQWNRLAFRVNNLFQRDIHRGAHTLTYTPELLHRLPVLSANVARFCKWTSEEQKTPK